jgi:hypothetical protein
VNVWLPRGEVGAMKRSSTAMTAGLALGYVVVLGVVAGTLERSGHVAPAVVGAVVGALAGVGVAPVVVRRVWRQRFRAVGLADPDEVAQVRKAVRHGTAPADPHLDRPALDYVAQERNRMRVPRWYLIPAGLLVLALLDGVVVATGDPHAWVGLGALLLMAALLIFARTSALRKFDSAEAAIHARH